ncbi:hypothetical protein ElyMa_007060100 [Elysia marginata]|uniref:PiggyBac transposable element-derived protein domain-containing protein n=1 Tax=Elysia marginata TaxID=1093978 RepID=A0AAV4JVB3_9GAST|nr:hypothetical protein ElyMa_007060100 [Elysia marginata]
MAKFMNGYRSKMQLRKILLNNNVLKGTIHNPTTGAGHLPAGKPQQRVLLMILVTTELVQFIAPCQMNRRRGIRQIQPYLAQRLTHFLQQGFSAGFCNYATIATQVADDETIWKAHSSPGQRPADYAATTGAPIIVSMFCAITIPPEILKIAPLQGVSTNRTGRGKFLMKTGHMPGRIVFFYVLSNNWLMAARATKTIRMPRFITKDYKPIRFKGLATACTNKTMRMPILPHHMNGILAYRFLTSMTYTHNSLCS